MDAKSASAGKPKPPECVMKLHDDEAEDATTFFQLSASW